MGKGRYLVFKDTKPWVYQNKEDEIFDYINENCENCSRKGELIKKLKKALKIK